MKPAPTAVIGYGLIACGLGSWLASPRAEAQPAQGERDSQQRVDEERPPASAPEAEPHDPAAGPRADEPGRVGARRHRPGSRGFSGPRSRNARSHDKRPPGPRHDDRDRSPDFLTPQEREELMAFAKEHFPKMYELLRGSPRAHQHRLLRRVGWPMLRLLRLYRHDPELAEKLIAEHKIEMELAQLRRDYREFPSEAARENIKQKMRELLEQRFDLRQQRLELEIRALEKRLEEARQRLVRQEGDRQRLVETEVERIIDQLQDERMWSPSLSPLGAEPRNRPPPICLWIILNRVNVVSCEGPRSAVGR